MTMPFYVAPEQQMKDRADYARKGIARGRSVVVLHYAGRDLVRGREPVPGAAQGQRDLRSHRLRGRRPLQRVREPPPSRDPLRGLRGYSYDRTDVTGRGLANTYAQVLGTIFSSGGDKPYEVEIVVAELGATPALDQIYRLTYDGSVADEADFAVMGGSADVIAEVVSRGFTSGLSLAERGPACSPCAQLRWRPECGPARVGRGGPGGCHPRSGQGHAAQVPAYQR